MANEEVIGARWRLRGTPPAAVWCHESTKPPPVLPNKQPSGEAVSSGRYRLFVRPMARGARRMLRATGGPGPRHAEAAHYVTPNGDDAPQRFKPPARPGVYSALN